MNMMLASGAHSTLLDNTSAILESSTPMRNLTLTAGDEIQDYTVVPAAPGKTAEVF